MWSARVGSTIKLAPNEETSKVQLLKGLPPMRSQHASGKFQSQNEMFTGFPYWAVASTILLGDIIMVPSWGFLKQDPLSGRRSRRVATSAPAMLVIHSENRESIYRGTAIDSSEHGVRIKTSFTSLTSGQTVEVVLLGDLKRALRCRVVWVQPRRSDHYGHLGLEFVSPVLAQS